MNWLVRLLTFVLFLVVAGAVGVAVVLERASRYPVEANFLTPWLERNASEQIQGGIVAIEKTRIALEPGQGGARLLLSGVSASGGMASTPLDIGEMTVALSLPDLLLGKPRLTKIDIQELSFGARRQNDGAFAFSVTPRAEDDALMDVTGVPGLGGVAEASTSLGTANTGTEKHAPLEQLRENLLRRDGILSRFEELRLTGGSVVFDDAVVDERIVIHEAALTFKADRHEAKLEVDGLFEVGQSYADGRVTLTTPLHGQGLDLTTTMSDIALADIAVYLPKELYAEERTDPVDLNFSANLTDQGQIQNFSIQRYQLDALRHTSPTFAEIAPTLVASGMVRTGGAGGWSLTLQAPSETFASEPALEAALRDVVDFDGAVSGGVQMDIAEDGRLLNLTFDAAIGPGLVTLPALYQSPLELRGGRFKGQYSPVGLSFNQLEISPTLNGRDLAPAQIDLSIETLAPKIQRIRMNLDTPWQLTRDEILTLWPNANQDAGRQWFRNNIARGKTQGQSLTLDIETGGTASVVNDLKADIRFAGGAFKISDGLGYSSDATGRVTIDNGLYAIALDRATLGPLSAQDSSIRIDLRNDNDPRLTLQGKLNGPVRESLTYLSTADIGLDDIGNTIPIAKTSGLLEAQAEMTMSLAQPAVFKPDYDIRLDLQNLTVADYLGGLPLTAARLPVRIKPERIATTGAVNLGLIRTNATLDLDLDGGKLESLDLAASFGGNTQDAGTLLSFLPDYVNGEVSGDLNFTQDVTGRQSMSVEANLGLASIDLAPLPYFKPIGQPSMAEAELTFTSNGLASVDAFKIDGPALHLLGRIEMNARGDDLSRAELRNLIVGDNSLGSLTVVNEPQYMQVNINNGRLDGRPIIESILENQGKRDARIMMGDAETAEAKIAQKPWLINVSNLQQFVVPGGKSFTDINLTATIDDGAVIQFGLNAKSPANVRGRPPELGHLRASLTPQANGFYRLSFESDDAGSLLSTLNLTNEIRGGTIRVSADSALPLPKGGWLGSMEMLDFLVVDAPIMVQLLSLASLTGILELAAGGGLQFTNLTSNFTYGNSALYLDDLRMAGPSVGLTTEGSIDFEGKRFALQGNVTPFNLVSEIAASIPIFGQVLTGTDGGGLFSAGYKVDGPFSNPAVSVNPFQILTPGIYRQWFQDIIGNN